MLFNIVVGVAVLALIALIVAVVPSAVAFGWAAIVISAIGLVLLSIQELALRGRGDPEIEAAVEDVVQPDIWPPRHPPEPQPTDDQRSTLRPDIWP